MSKHIYYALKNPTCAQFLYVTYWFKPILSRLNAIEVGSSLMLTFAKDLKIGGDWKIELEELRYDCINPACVFEFVDFTKFCALVEERYEYYPVEKVRELRASLTYEEFSKLFSHP